MITRCKGKETIKIDVQHLPPCRKYAYLVEARCDLTGYVVARPLRSATAKELKKFFVEEILLESLIKYRAEGLRPALHHMFNAIRHSLIAFLRS